MVVKMYQPEELSIDYTIHSNEDYTHTIHIGESLTIAYNEPNANINIEFSFGSLEEMESVAKTMLMAVKSARELAKQW